MGYNSLLSDDHEAPHVHVDAEKTQQQQQQQHQQEEEEQQQPFIASYSQQSKFINHQHGICVLLCVYKLCTNFQHILVVPKNNCQNLTIYRQWEPCRLIFPHLAVWKYSGYELVCLAYNDQVSSWIVTQKISWTCNFQCSGSINGQTRALEPLKAAKECTICDITQPLNWAKTFFGSFTYTT